MKKCLSILIAILTLLCVTGFANATLVTIGTANYGGTNYNLIYDDDDTGYDGGGLVWLDYMTPVTTWQNQMDWASGVGTSFSVNLADGYTTTIDWTTGWRLPDTVDGEYDYHWGGDPNNDGDYDYTAGYNLANSEMGHLFYAELENIGIINTDGSSNLDYGIVNTGDFDNLTPSHYWSSTEYTTDTTIAWYFDMNNGAQSNNYKESLYYGSHYTGMAVIEGTVSFDDGSQSNPVPEPCTMLLLGSGLIGLVKVGKKRAKR